MEVEITLEHGPIKAEINASEEDDYTEVLEKLANFLEDHPDLTESRAQKPTNDLTEEERDQEEVEVSDAPLSQFANKTEGGRQQVSYSETAKETEETVENEMLRSLLEQTGVSEEEFIRVFEVHEDVTPRILDPDNIPGDSPGQTILNASAILLTIWQECYGEDWMKTSDLSDALEQSGLSDRTDYIYNQDNWQSLFNRDGKGRGTKLRVTRLGKDKAEELIQEMSS